ncbi:MAG: 6-carboxytetrahydropterin synthase QueD [Candidatus Eisenbacteria bacterium]|uniref:6-carboxy-5,6,7,8-tetrahydropterin synthase n=1 Tax=Eiseniibacteriota bacterium TaxID=2212470 RepID=A0A937XAC8_UNCEI|nr:6-carboxytetrahydropterin synthase QueD [Candidatus Eisenbacteria bacterium]
MELSRTFEFSAAHALPASGEGHRCRGVHGHNFTLEVVVRGRPDPERGWVIDFGDIKRAVEPLLRELDHRWLNDVPGLENPTSETLVRWLWTRLAPVLPGLARLSVGETPHTRCTYWGEE